MRPATRFGLPAFLLAAGGLWLLLSGGGAEAPRPPAPEAPPDPQDAAAEAPAGAFSPDSLPMPVPPEALEEDAGEEPPGDAPPHELLARAAMLQLGPLFRELGDVTAYLDGKPVEEWALVGVGPEVRAQLLAVLRAGTPDARMQAALALSMAELSAQDVAVLRDRFDAELDSMAGEARKNLVLALSFALHTHGDPHGTRGLADALRTGAGSEVKNFRNGAAMVLALADVKEEAPLLRELLLSDPDKQVRKHSAVGLGRFGGEENRAALEEALVREENLEVRAWSALAAGRAAEPGGDDSALRRSLVEDPAGEVRGAAAYALSRAGGEGTEAALREAFYADDHPFARIGAIAGIAERDADGSSADFLSGQGAPYLAEVIREEENGVARFYAVKAAAAIPDAAARGAMLRQAAENDPWPWVKGAAAATLIDTEGEAARPFLEERLAAEENEPARQAIRRALDRLPKEQ